jgi:hypothetical protein
LNSASSSSSSAASLSLTNTQPWSSPTRPTCEASGGKGRGGLRGEKCVEGRVEAPCRASHSPTQYLGCTNTTNPRGQVGEGRRVGGCEKQSQSYRQHTTLIIPTRPTRTYKNPQSAPRARGAVCVLPEG